MSVKQDQGQKRVVKVDTTLAKGLLVLEALARSDNGVGVSELARELNLTKSNTFRLLQSLVALGYARNSEQKLYFATMKVWQVGLQVIDNLDLPQVAAPHLRRLSEQTGEAIYLAIRDGFSVVYIDKIESTQPIRSWNPIGGSAPLHCVGTGKALLAADYERLRHQMPERLIRFTERTITGMDDLDADMAATQARGYALDTGEYRDRILSFGAAVRLPNGQPIAAVGLSMPDVNFENSSEESMGLLVLKAADRISAGLRDN